jgi:hypothetical protein
MLREELIGVAVRKTWYSELCSSGLRVWALNWKHVWWKMTSDAAWMEEASTDEKARG